MGWNLRERFSFVFITEDSNIIDNIVNDLEDHSFYNSEHVMFISEETPNVYYLPVSIILKNTIESYGLSVVVTGETDLLSLDSSRFTKYQKALKDFFDKHFEEKNPDGYIRPYVFKIAGSEKLLKYAYFQSLTENLMTYMKGKISINNIYNNKIKSTILKFITDLKILEDLLGPYKRKINQFQELNAQLIEKQISKVKEFNAFKENNRDVYQFASNLFSDKSISFEFYYFTIYNEELDIFNLAQSLRSIESFDTWYNRGMTGEQYVYYHFFDSPYLDPDYPD